MSIPRSMSRVLVSMLCVLAVGLGGCRGMSGYPERTIDREKTITALEKTFDPVSVIKNYHAAQNTPSEPEKVSLRNGLIDSGVVLMDLRFYDFVEEFASTKKGADTITEIGAIGVNGVAAVITPSSATQVLSAISGGLIASNASINKNFFYEQTVPVLVKAMEAKRRQIAADLIAGQTKSTTLYPLGGAITDLARYYAAGTFEGSLGAISEQADETKKVAEDRITKAREEAEKRITGLAKEFDSWKDFLAINDAQTANRADRARASLRLALLLRTPDQATRLVAAAFATRMSVNWTGSPLLTPVEADAVFGNHNPLDPAAALVTDAFITMLEQNRAQDTEFLAALLAALDVDVPAR